MYTQNDHRLARILDSHGHRDTLKNRNKLFASILMGRSDKTNRGVSRRQFLYSAGAASLWGRSVHAQDAPTIIRTAANPAIKIPVIGMGSWITFNVDPDSPSLAQRANVLNTFFEQGGQLIDSSPMYGHSEEVIGQLTQQLDRQEQLISTTKVWTVFEQRGPEQLSDSLRLWRRPTLDLVSVHNLLNWKSHLPMLRDAKESGLIRYVGLTTSHGRRHEELEGLLRKSDVDFVQFSYNILNRRAEQRLLPTALDQGVGVIINRPFQTGALFRRFASRPLPPWAEEIDCYSWAEFFLKFVVSHPAVTCVIPATSQVSHMLENMRAGRGRLPDSKTRQNMVRYVEQL